jgi:hypothetical protein
VNALVSLPSGVGDSPLLETLLLEPVDDMLKGFADTMLRSQCEVDQLVALNGRPNTYMDPVLENSPPKICTVRSQVSCHWDFEFHSTMQIRAGNLFRQKEAQQITYDFRLLRNQPLIQNAASHKPCYGGRPREN